MRVSVWIPVWAAVCVLCVLGNLPVSPAVLGPAPPPEPSRNMTAQAVAFCRERAGDCNRHPMCLELPVRRTMNDCIDFCDKFCIPGIPAGSFRILPDHRFSFRRRSQNLFPHHIDMFSPIHHMVDDDSDIDDEDILRERGFRNTIPLCRALGPSVTCQENPVCESILQNIELREEDRQARKLACIHYCTLYCDQSPQHHGFFLTAFYQDTVERVNRLYERWAYCLPGRQ